MGSHAIWAWIWLITGLVVYYSGKRQGIDRSQFLHTAVICSTIWIATA